MSHAECPICAGSVVLPDSVEVSEMLTCSECGNKVVVTAVSGEGAVLGEAPKVEEDWGE